MCTEDDTGTEVPVPAGKKYYTYMVRCADGTLYTGYTTDPEKRVRTHNSGKGAKYTRSRGPVTLVFCREADSKHDAMSLEARIKLLTRKEKEALIASCNFPVDTVH